MDNANYETGQILVVQALSKLLAGHKPASYGVAPGTVPSPAPTPSASLPPLPTSTRPANRQRTKPAHRRPATPSPSATAAAP